ncbi:MAG: DUF3575 domain-containing protein [Muribaculaceae bacterium]|nr:DUF3575 domain-containing protein [Muribaculaceae bacterium]
MKRTSTYKFMQNARGLIRTFVSLILICIGSGIIKASPDVPDSSGRFAVSSNALYWLTATPNVGAEWAASARVSFAASFGYNALNLPSSFGVRGGASNPKLRHWLLTQESRLWMRRVFEGSYFGLHLMGGKYNVGGLRFPGILRDYRYQGYLLGAGVSYGYEWRLADNWRIGASIGAGWVYLNYSKNNCGSCGTRLSHRARNLATITKASISFTYIFPSSSRTKDLKDLKDFKALKDSEDLNGPKDPVLPQEEPGASEVPAVAEEIAQPCILKETFVIGYPVDDSRFHPDFGSNRAELSRLDSLISAAASRILTITVSGYASPEHTYAHNLTLSSNRAAGVAEYILEVYGSFIGSSGPMEVGGRGEDWAGMCRDLISNPSFGDSETMLREAERYSDPDRREGALRRLLGEEKYSRLKALIYPRLRRTVIEITYEDTCN